MPQMQTGDKEYLLDARGLMCPEPLRLAQLQMGRMAAGERLRVLATDPAADIDLESWCRRRGHAILSCEACEPGWEIVVQKGVD